LIPHYFKRSNLSKIFFRNRGGNGTSVSVTQSSGSPYIHGKPRQPIQQPQTQMPQNPGYQLQYPNYNFSTVGGQSFQQAPQVHGKKLTSKGVMI